METSVTYSEKQVVFDINKWGFNSFYDSDNHLYDRRVFISCYANTICNKTHNVQILNNSFSIDLEYPFIDSDYIYEIKIDQMHIRSLTQKRSNAFYVSLKVVHFVNFTINCSKLLTDVP